MILLLLTIVLVIHRANDIPDDNYLYRLVEDNEKWSWASSMFEPEF